MLFYNFIQSKCLSIQEEGCKEQENSEEEWNLMEESIVNNVVHIHNQLFGSNSFALTVSCL